MFPRLNRYVVIHILMLYCIPLLHTLLYIIQLRLFPHLSLFTLLLLPGKMFPSVIPNPWQHTYTYFKTYFRHLLLEALLIA